MSFRNDPSPGDRIHNKRIEERRNEQRWLSLKRCEELADVVEVTARAEPCFGEEVLGETLSLRPCRSLKT